MSVRRGMEAGDWINASVNVVIGVFLGIAVNGLAQIFMTGFWQLAVFIVIVTGVAVLFLFMFDGLLNRVSEQIFPSGVRPAHRPQPEGRKPIARLLSLPAGMVLGVILAQLGLTQTILGLF